MTVYLRKAPTWALSVYNGVLIAVIFGVFWPIFLHDSHFRVATVVAGAVVAGVIFGLIAGPVAARQWRRTEEATGPLTDDEYRIANRATIRGPVPADPRLRAAASALAAIYHRRVSRVPRGVVVALVVLEAGVAVLYAATAESPSDYAYAALFVVLAATFGWQLWYRRNLQRRIGMLCDTESQA